MARPKEWERMARKLRMSLDAVVQDMTRKHGMIMGRCENGAYKQADGLFLRDQADMGLLIGKADALQSELGALVEDNMEEKMSQVEKEIAAIKGRRGK